MGKKFRAALLLLIVASCGRYAPPSNLNDACAIAQERPSFLRAMRRSETRWGVPIAVQMAVIRQESKFVGNARTPYRWALGIIPMGRASSALGFAQAVDGTWDDYKRDTGNWGANRKNMADATDFMGWYMDRAYQKVGIPKTDARDQYLAYHEGIAGFAAQSYNAKGWLISVASRVQSNAQIYAEQLRGCGLD